MKILSPAGRLGTAFPEESLDRALDEEPDFIGVDSGTTDCGPHSLGSGEPDMDVSRDLELLVLGAVENDVPLLVGSAGTAGADPHLEIAYGVLTDILDEHGLDVSVAKIHAELSAEYLKEKLRNGEVSPLSSNAPELDERLVDRAEHIVGAMGADPYVTAVENGADIVLAGRSCDSAIFAGLAIREGYPPGLAWHLGKTLECGNSCVESRPHQDCIMGYLHDDHFVVKPVNPGQRCTPGSVASHALYENANPYRFRVPTGELSTRGCEYEQHGDRSVKVSGSRFERADQPTIKVEAAEHVGYQAYYFAGMRDPLLVETIDDFVERVERDFHRRVEATKEGVSRSDYSVEFYIYGKNGTMGDREPINEQGYELGFAFQVVAETQELATDLATMLRFDVSHKSVPGWEGSVTNIATPLSPRILEHGPRYQFTMNHAIEVDDPQEPFRIAVEEVSYD